MPNPILVELLERLEETYKDAKKVHSRVTEIYNRSEELLVTSDSNLKEIEIALGNLREEINKSSGVH